MITGIRSRCGALVALGALGVLAAMAPANAAAARQNQAGVCGSTRNDFDYRDGLYDAINDNGDGRIGPRRLVVNQSGRIVSRTTRLFVQATPLDAPRVRLIIRTGGRGRIGVAICATAEGTGARQTVLSQFEMEGGERTTRLLRGVKHKRISVRLRGIRATSSVGYTMLLERTNAGEVWEPTQRQLESLPRPIEGFADLHNHHASRWGFAGGWYAGEMEGPILPDRPDHLAVLSVSVPGLVDFVLRPGHGGTAIPAWNDTSHNQMGFDALRSAHQNGLRLIVSSAVNSQWLCAILARVGVTDRRLSCQDMESAKYQIVQMKRFDERHDWYRIVTNPWEARDAINRGQLAVVLGVEVSNLFPTSDGDWRRQLDELYAMGVRQVYLAHESNNRFAGAALHHTETLSVPNALTAWFSPEIDYGSDANGNNSVGLTELGRLAVNDMMHKNMLIDIDHISWRAVDAVAELSEDHRYYPLFAGHTRATEILTPEHREVVQELNTPESVLGHILRTGGMVGLRTGPERMLPYPGSGVLETCGGSVTSLIQTYRHFADRGVPVAFGTDLSGFVEMTGPRFGPDACPDAPPGGQQAQQAAQLAPQLADRPAGWALYAERGLADISALPTLLFDMRYLGADTANLESSAEAFIRMWTRAYQDGTRAVVPPPPGSGLVTTPTR